MYGSIPYNILQYLVVPVDSTLGADGTANYRISSCFAPFRRLSNGVERAHTGIDVVPTSNDRTIKAAAGGLVAVANNTNNYNCYSTQCEGLDGRGNYVTIRHEIEGTVFFTHYYHLSSVNVSSGDRVEAGDIIGTMGNTGHSSGDHLHFQYNDSNNSPVNPGNLFTNPSSISPNAGCSMLAFECASKNAPVATSPIMGKWNGNSYPISVTVNGNPPIPLEQYVLGVTLNEMSASENIEALKAQIVAARTYTFGGKRFSSFKLNNNQIVINMGRADQNTQTFNLNSICSLDALSQQKILLALEAVRGQVLTYNDQMFSSEYSSCSLHSGGVTSGYVYKVPNTNNEKVEAYCQMSGCGEKSNTGICGHGRGMSQRGAYKLANDGYSYTSILSHYYYGGLINIGDIELSIYSR
jgi:hypothetical protein